MPSNIPQLASQYSLEDISITLQILLSIIAVTTAVGGFGVWLWRLINPKVEFTISTINSSSPCDGWVLSKYKGQRSICIPGNYYPRINDPSPSQKARKWTLEKKAWLYKRISQSTPFLQKPKYYFCNLNYAGLDPIFDVLVTNQDKKSLVITDLGIQICSVAHEMQGMGSPPARKIDSLGDYRVCIPNINEDIQNSGVWEDRRVLETQNINQRFLAEISEDKFVIESNGILRYKLQLDNYVCHVPTLSIIRLWIKNKEGTIFSSPYVRLDHIGPN